jgi:hypothetical protein
MDELREAQKTPSSEGSFLAWLNSELIMLGVYVKAIDSQESGFTYSEGACHRDHILEGQENEIGDRATNVSRLPQKNSDLQATNSRPKKGLKQTGPDNEGKEGEHTRSSHWIEGGSEVPKLTTISTKLRPPAGAVLGIACYPTDRT